MTEKRFTALGSTHLRDNETGKEFYAPCEWDLLELLNELNNKCEFLEIENESLEDGATRYAELYHQSLKENEQLKKEILWLKYCCGENINGDD